MSRINTNVQSMIAQHVLGRQNRALNTSMERLSIGLKINAGKDNPAGLIASENLRGQKAGIAQAIVNAERANNMIGTAEGALNEVSALLVELQTLVTDTANSGGLTQEEVDANQQQVDSILSSINRISNATQFGSKKLLDGSMDYTTSGVTAADLDDVKVNSTRLTTGVAKTVQVEVTNSAEFAQIKFSAAGLASTNSVTIEVAGNKGSEILTFAGSTAISAMKAAINALTDVTGVSATTSGVAALYFSSPGYGSSQFVSVDVVEGTFTTSADRDTGVDPTVLINGQAAEAEGLGVSLRTATLDVDLTLTAGFADGLNSSTFYITGGGADFMIGGEASTSNKASVGIGSVSTVSLGNSDVGLLASLATGGANSLSGGNAVDAQAVVDKAVSQVSNLRGRLGAFQKFTLAPTINSLEAGLENTSAAESAIRDTDFAVETANLMRSQILSNAATNVLAMANAAPQSVLSLLR